MSWFAVDDRFHSHAKVEIAGLAAIGLWTVAGSLCRARRSDGFVTDAWVTRQPQGRTLARRLVTAGLWEETTDDDLPGYRFRDWADWQLAEDALEQRRERDRARQAKRRAAIGGDA